jgi:ribose transport system substrate-binding protein
VRCITAQLPYQQGIAAAQTVILSLLARPVPAWIALPGLKVTRKNVVESFQTVWRLPAPKEIIRVLGLAVWPTPGLLQHWSSAPSAWTT